MGFIPGTSTTSEQKYSFRFARTAELEKNVSRFGLIDSQRVLHVFREVYKSTVAHSRA